MKLDVQMRQETLVIEVQEDRIDAVAVLEFKETMRLACATPSERILLDLSRVDFVDSSGLGAIVSIMKQVGAGRAFELCDLQPNVDKVFQLTRMDTIFTIHRSVVAAFAA